MAFCYYDGGEEPSGYILSGSVLTSMVSSCNILL